MTNRKPANRHIDLQSCISWLVRRPRASVVINRSLHTTASELKTTHIIGYSERRGESAAKKWRNTYRILGEVKSIYSENPILQCRKNF